MTKSELSYRLYLWGRVYGRRGQVEVEDRSLTGNSSIAAWGRSSGHVPCLRSGASRRELMGAAAGIRRVPMDYVDPIPCIASRSGPRPDYDPRITQEVERVQSVWLALKRSSDYLAEVVRVEYHLEGSQRDKAERMGLTYKQYRMRLDAGRAALAEGVS